jgi:hypothetical protein
MDCAQPKGGSRVWRTLKTTHIDVRGLEPPEPMVAILRTIDSREVDATVIAHLDREPIFLYPELDERGWSHEVIPSPSGGANNVTLRLVRVLR